MAQPPCSQGSTPAWPLASGLRRCRRETSAARSPLRYVRRTLIKGPGCTPLCLWGSRLSLELDTLFQEERRCLSTMTCPMPGKGPCTRKAPEGKSGSAAEVRIGQPPWPWGLSSWAGLPREWAQGCVVGTDPFRPRGASLRAQPPRGWRTRSLGEESSKGSGAPCSGVRTRGNDSAEPKAPQTFGVSNCWVCAGRKKCLVTGRKTSMRMSQD